MKALLVLSVLATLACIACGGDPADTVPVVKGTPAPLNAEELDWLTGVVAVLPASVADSGVWYSSPARPCARGRETRQDRGGVGIGAPRAARGPLCCHRGRSRKRDAVLDVAVLPRLGRDFWLRCLGYLSYGRDGRQPQERCQVQRSARDLQRPDTSRKVTPPGSTGSCSTSGTRSAVIWASNT